MRIYAYMCVLMYGCACVCVCVCVCARVCRGERLRICVGVRGMWGPSPSPSLSPNLPGQCHILTTDMNRHRDL